MHFRLPPLLGMWGWHLREPLPAVAGPSRKKARKAPDVAATPAQSSASSSGPSTAQAAAAVTGVPALRQDGPSRRAATQGAWRPLSPEGQSLALAELDRDIYAASARGPQASRLKIVRSILASWGVDPFPPTPFHLRALAASLKSGGYASASAYLATYKVEGERQGFAWPPAMTRAYKDYCRSCDRG